MSDEIFTYRTIRSSSDGKFTDKGSKFLATVWPVRSAEDIDACLTDIKALHPKARHICFAYRLLVEGKPVEYATDAGEPGGSAGVPILNALKSNEVFNVLGVVARYFGGTKLGIPGLIQAYRESVEEALASADIVQSTRVMRYTLSMPMALQPHFLEACKRLEVEVSDFTYTDRFELKIDLPLKAHAEDFERLLQLVSKRTYADVEDYLGYLDVWVEGMAEI